MTAGRPRESTAPTVYTSAVNHYGHESPSTEGGPPLDWVPVDTEDHRNKACDIGTSPPSANPPPTIHNCLAQWEKINMVGQQWERAGEGGAEEQPKPPPPITSFKLKEWYKGHNGPGHTSHKEGLWCVRLPTQKGLCTSWPLWSAVLGS